MKYALLTKEQLEELHTEFATFLASQQIDANEWNSIKKNKPHLAEEEIQIFSDLVWDKVLINTKFIEHISESHLNLFQCNSKEIIRIYVKATAENFNFLNEKNFKHFVKNPLDNQFEFYKASKKYNDDRNTELFKLIEMGGQITNGELFKKLALLIH